MMLGIVLHDLSLGGTERIALRLANEWARQGVAVTIFCGSRSGLLADLAGPQVAVVESPQRIERGRRSRARLASAAARYFHAHPVDVCFVPGNYHWPVVPALAALPLRTQPVVVAQVSAALDKPQRGPLRQQLFNLRMRYLLRSVDGLVCMSRLAAAQANRIVGRNVAISIPLPALDEGHAAPLPVPRNCRHLLAAGRLVREKGFDTLISAFALLNDPTARLTILGAGPDESRLRERLSGLGLAAQVAMPGFASEIRSWLNDSRGFVLSSRFEGFGAVLVEALAAGRQVITTRCTHAVDDLAIGGDIGQVVPVDDAAAMAAAMRRLLDTPPAEPQALAATVVQYRIQPLAAEYLRAFERWRASRRALRRPWPVSRAFRGVAWPW